MMKRILGAIPTLLTILTLAVLGLAIARPDLVPLAAIVRGGGHDPASHDEPAAPPLGKKIGTVDDGWSRVPAALADAGGPEQLPIVRLDSDEVAARIGLRISSAERREVVDRIEANAESVFNANAYAEVSPRVRGLIRDISGEEGMPCEPGTVLAVVDSAEVGTAKAEYLAASSSLELAEETFKRTTELVASDAAPRKMEIEARAGLNRARADRLNAEQRLLNFGFTAKQIQEMAGRSDTSSLLPIVSPIHGNVVDRHAVTGEAVEPTTRLFVVADTDKIWLWIDMYESEFGLVSPGQPVEFVVPSSISRSYRGVVEWIDPAVNTKTRTIRVRAVVDNPEHSLRANEFGTAIVDIGQPRQAVLVPRDAVQGFDAAANLVFLPQDGRTFRPQRIVTRASRQPGMLEVVWGLQGGEQVVTTGSFPLLSELKREEIAGE